MSEPAAVDIRDVWFAYNGEPVLREVNLRIDPRELVCVVGPNGGGKTTLLKLMLGLLRPDRGEVRILGQTPVHARPRVGYTPQHSQLDPKFPVNVMDVVLMGRLGGPGRLGPHRRADRNAAREALAEVGLDPLRRRSFAELSGGQQQRVMIARALAAGPQLLLLDEPAAGLDVGAEAEFHQLLLALARQRTVVLVSHDIGFVSEVVGKVVCVRATVAVHPTADLTGELIQELYGHDIRLVRHDHDCLTSCPEGDG